MDVFERIAEARIKGAIAAGELDDLPGAGRPLERDPMTGVPADLRPAYRLLRNSGFVPEEVNVRRGLSELAERIAAAHPEDDLRELRRRRAALELKRNLATERRAKR